MRTNMTENQIRSRRPYLLLSRGTVRRSTSLFAFDDRTRISHRVEPVAELLGDRAGVHAVPDQLRPDEHDDLGPRPVAVRGAEQASQILDVAQPGNSVP